MLPINNTTDDITLLRKLQFNPQSLKCLISSSFNNSAIHCFINIIIDSSFLPCNKIEMKIYHEEYDIENHLSFSSGF